VECALVKCRARTIAAIIPAILASACETLDREANTESAAEAVQSIEVIRLNRPAERRQLPPKRGERISTDAGAIAVIRYSNGSVVFVTPGSVVRVGSVFVEVGEVFAKVKGLFQVETQFVIAGAEGTEYAVRVNRRDDVTVAVMEGSVRCRSRKFRWPEFFLRPGERAYFEAQDFPAADRASDAEFNSLKRRLAELERIASSP
jgi:hypothetical protein